MAQASKAAAQSKPRRGGQPGPAAASARTKISPAAPVATITVPLRLIEALAAIKFPPRTDRRMQVLMDLNNDGALTPEQYDELESLVELNESVSLLKAQAVLLLKHPLA